MAKANFKISVDNRDEFIREAGNKILKALESCGLVAETYAKQKAPVDTGNLRNSISHDIIDTTMYVGTNVEYAPYNEFGTGINYSGGRRTSWVYQDAKGEWHKTNGMVARPFIKPSIADHQDEYKKIIEAELKS